jgi:hypothetical protein
MPVSQNFLWSQVVALRVGNRQCLDHEDICMYIFRAIMAEDQSAAVSKTEVVWF